MNIVTGSDFTIDGGLVPTLYEVPRRRTCRPLCCLDATHWLP